MPDSDKQDDGLWYPTVDDILLLHDDIIAEDEESEPGVEDADRIQFAIDYIQHGHMGEVPETIHEKAFQLMRLLAANHWFVDGNKRTALNATIVFYWANGYRLNYDQDIRAMLKLLALRGDLFDPKRAAEYLADQTTELTGDLIEYGPESGFHVAEQFRIRHDLDPTPGEDEEDVGDHNG